MQGTTKGSPEQAWQGLFPFDPAGRKTGASTPRARPPRSGISGPGPRGQPTLRREPAQEYPMDIRHLQAAIIVVAATLLPAGAALADEDIPIDQLPPAVIKAIEARFPGAKIEEAERDTRDGRPLYEVEIEVNGDDKELKITPDGQIIDIED